jgi:hypothetical protein
MFYIAIGLIPIGFIADTFQTDRFCSDRFQTDTFYSDTFCLGASFTEAEFLEEIQTKVLRVFLLDIYNHHYSFCLEIYISSNSRNLLQFLQYTVKDQRGKSDRKPFSLPYGLRNPNRNLKSENCQDYDQKHQQNCTFMNSASEHNKGRSTSFAVRSLLFIKVSQM